MTGGVAERPQLAPTAAARWAAKYPGISALGTQPRDDDTRAVHKIGKALALTPGNVQALDKSQAGGVHEKKILAIASWSTEMRSSFAIDPSDQPHQRWRVRR
jgi:hypothetical protein